MTEDMIHSVDKYVNNDEKTDTGISSPSQLAREDNLTFGGKNNTAIDSEGDSEKTYPHGLRLFFVVVALALSNFLVALVRLSTYLEPLAVLIQLMWLF